MCSPYTYNSGMPCFCGTGPRTACVHYHCCVLCFEAKCVCVFMCVCVCALSLLCIVALEQSVHVWALPLLWVPSVPAPTAVGSKKMGIRDAVYYVDDQASELYGQSCVIWQELSS